MTNQTPNFYALLIGINFYFPHRLPEGNYYKNLRGCVQDINHVETYLKDTFNLTPDPIIKLTATASDNPNQPQEPPELLPTYENIVTKFKELTAKAKPQDRVYIHYSGHGGRAKTIFEDVKGSMGLDEALVPCDIGQPNSRYLRDLEFAKLLEEMVAKELVVTLVLDSCHSGGATRDIETDDWSIRSGGFIDMTLRPTDSLVAPLQELAQNWQASTENSRNITVVNGLLPEPKGYTLIAACRDQEFAYEKVFEGTERNGALTYFLLKALREYRGTELAVADLFNQISNLVHNDFDRQTPMLIGETNRTFLGGQSVSFTPGASLLRSVPVTRSTHTVPVMKVDITKNRVQLQMGEASGLKQGAEFDIFRFGTWNFEDREQRIATVKLVELGASDCWAEVTGLHNEFTTRELKPKLREGIIEIGSPAVYVGPPLEQIRKVRVLLPDPLPKIPGVDVSSLPGMLATKKEEVKNHSWIEFCPETEKDENVNYFVSVNSQGEYLILDANKEPIKNVLFPIKIDAPESATKLINRLIHITIYQNRLELDNEDAFSPLNGKLKVELVQSVKRQIVVLNADGKVPLLEKDTEVTLRIRNESNRILNITALNFDMDYSIEHFYPKGANYEVVEPGQERTEDLKLSLPENYEEGVNVIKVFATVDATNYHLWELPALDQDLQGRKAAVVTKASNEWTTEKVEFVLR
ncbi:caspase family protein [Microcoleus sp. Pol17_C1]|uniref:caspase family protein n=1 Tax=unclassified Microcoleus TaxID=2642155 RepID=UPI002FD134F2